MLSQVRFGDIKNGSLNTGLDDYLALKANASDLASKANINTVTNLEAIINGTTGLNTKADKSALDIVKTTADTAFSTANNAMPELSIIAYAGSNNLPAGWQLCDGSVLAYYVSNPIEGMNDNVSVKSPEVSRFTNLKKMTVTGLPGQYYTTPDLRGRFILGSNPAKVNGATTNFDRNIRLINETGGEEKHTLSEAEMPRHKHLTVRNVNSGENILLNTQSVALQRTNKGWENYYFAFSNAEPDAGSSTYQGESQSHENMPPFYVLTYIIKKPIKTPTTTV